MQKLLQIATIGLILLAGCSSGSLSITGDVDKVYYIHQSDNLEAIFKYLTLKPENALIEGYDGTSVYLDSQAFSEIQLWNKNGVWESESKTLPAVSNIKNIKEICVFQPLAKYEIQVQELDKIRFISPFQAKTNQYKILGESSKNGFHTKKLKKNTNTLDFLTADSLEISFTNKQIKKCYQQDYDKIELQNFYFSVESDTIKSIRMLP